MLDKPNTAPVHPPQTDLVLANTVSRLGCTVAQARKILGWPEPTTSTAQTAAPKSPTSKGTSAEELL